MELDELTGVLFVNDFKSNDKHPDFSGEVLIEGSVYKVGLWHRVSKKGKKFISLKLTFKEHPI